MKEIQDEHRAEVEQLMAQVRLAQQENSTSLHKIEAFGKEAEYFK